MKRSTLLPILLVGVMISPSVLLAQTEWIAQESEHFLLYTDTDLNKGGRLLNDLEGRYKVFSQVFYPLEPRASRISVVLVDDRQDFLEWVPEQLKTHDLAAYLLSGSGGHFLLARDSSTESIADDVGHALGHLLLSRSVMWQPFWLQEGIGEYLKRLGRSRGGDPVSREDGFSLSDILTIVPSRNYDDLAEGGVFRRQSYQLLRVLLESYPEELDAYIQSLRGEGGFDATLDVVSDSVESELFQYEDSSLGFAAMDLASEARPVPAGERDAMLGNLALSAGLRQRARSLYAASPLESGRIGLALLGRGRAGSGGRPTFEKLIVDFPESGLAHYYMGTLEPETDEDRRVQISALERAVDLMPQSGRPRAELGWLYVLDERPQQALPFVEQALRLAPEYADRFYEILAEAQLSLGDYETAGEYIQIAASLPHSDVSSLERYDRLVPEFYRKMESHRRLGEAERMEALRREVEVMANRLDPRPVVVSEVPAPVGRIRYSISPISAQGVTAPPIRESPMPDYTPDLRRRGVEGRVVLEVDLDRRGRIANIGVRSSEDPELSTQALDAVGRWRFDSARRGFESTEYSFRLTLTFYLE